MNLHREAKEAIETKEAMEVRLPVTKQLREEANEVSRAIQVKIAASSTFDFVIGAVEGGLSAT